MSDATPVRIGFIGCGGIARHHLNQLQHIPGVSVTALCDIAPAAIERCRKQFPDLLAEATDCTQAELLARDDVDAVQICTPHTLHFDQANAAMDAQKHILCEKPFVCKVEDAHALLARIETYPKVFALAYQRHAQGQFVYIRDKIASGDMGAVTFVSALQAQSWKKGTAGTWRQTMELSGGGQLNDSGSHLLDIILWTTGLTVANVSAFIDNRGTPVDQNSAVTFTTTSGAQGTITVVGDTVVGWHEDITIWCERGAFFYRNGKLEVVDEKGGRTTLDGANLPPSRNIDEDWIRTIRGEQSGPAAPPINGLRTIELTEAAWRSGAQGGIPVRMN
ncbi:MAG: Gfo/Idh/MocA family oxidoreductase [Akkermansiaceae bacterium]|nr:Gfo/Idh/MocA family oxidoreductase [Armatimonadota bacterium]